MKLSTQLSSIAIIAATLSSTPVSAVELGPWLLRLAAESGGDDVATVEFTNGDREKIKGGGLLHIEGGKQLSLFVNNPALVTEFTLGFKRDAVNASNGDIKFTRFTLNAMQYYQYNEKIRAGFGTTYHMNAEVDVSFPGLSGSVDIDDSLGFMLGADYAYSDQVNLGARATLIDYDSDFASDVSGNSFGVYASFYF